MFLMLQAYVTGYDQELSLSEPLFFSSSILNYKFFDWTRALNEIAPRQVLFDFFHSRLVQNLKSKLDSESKLVNAFAVASHCYYYAAEMNDF